MSRVTVYSSAKQKRHLHSTDTDGLLHKIMYEYMLIPVSTDRHKEGPPRQPISPSTMCIRPGLLEFSKIGCHYRISYGRV
jgi:hypothetical protein